MSTNAFIGKVNPDQTVSYIYCHWDGYEEGVGKTLMTHYTNPALIDKLLDLGDLSMLGNIPESDPEGWRGGSVAEDKCLTYRDRGEKQVDKKTVASKDDYYREGKEFMIPYLYLFENGKWFVRSVKSDKNKPLTASLK